MGGGFGLEKGGGGNGRCSWEGKQEEGVVALKHSCVVSKKREADTFLGHPFKTKNFRKEVAFQASVDGKKRDSFKPRAGFAWTCGF